MITKEEFLEWKKHPCTNILIEMLYLGKEMATESLIGRRGEVGDFDRGALEQLDEILNIVKDGYGMYEEKKKNV